MIVPLAPCIATQAAAEEEAPAQEAPKVPSPAEAVDAQVGALAGFNEPRQPRMICVLY